MRTRGKACPCVCASHSVVLRVTACPEWRWALSQAAPTPSSGQAREPSLALTCVGCACALALQGAAGLDDKPPAATAQVTVPAAPTPLLRYSLAQSPCQREGGGRGADVFARVRVYDSVGFGHVVRWRRGTGTRRAWVWRRARARSHGAGAQRATTSRAACHSSQARRVAHPQQALPKFGNWSQSTRLSHSIHGVGSLAWNNSSVSCYVPRNQLPYLGKDWLPRPPISHSQRHSVSVTGFTGPAPGYSKYWPYAALWGSVFLLPLRAGPVNSGAETE